MDSKAISSSESVPGQAVYTPAWLRWYDWLVLRISNTLVWKCPTPVILDHHNQFVSDNHLDVGVGSGYFPDHCTFPGQSPSVALMDLNENALQFAADRIIRYRPEVFRRDVMQPIELERPPFQSVAVNYLLHCLPGSLSHKAIIFDHLKPHVANGGVIFGATLLHEGVRRGSPHGF